MLTIKTNNVPRLIQNGHDLPASVRADFDYLTDEELVGRDFIQYKGHWYDLGEFMRVTGDGMGNPQWSTFHGYASDSYFSGVLVRYVGDDHDHVVMATYYS